MLWKKHFLKMQGLYLDIFIICHKLSSMLSLFNKLTLQKELQIFKTNNVFWQKNQIDFKTIK